MNSDDNEKSVISLSDNTPEKLSSPKTIIRPETPPAPIPSLILKRTLSKEIEKKLQKV